MGKDAYTHLPRECHDDDQEHHASDFLLLPSPREKTGLGSASLSLASVIATERPGPVVQTVEAATVESVLDATKSESIRSLEQALPLAVELAPQPADREEVGAGQGCQDGLEDGEGKDQSAEPGRSGADAAGGSDGSLDDGRGQKGDRDGDCGHGGRDGEGEGLQAVESISD
jgi:hypothetical protein